MQKIDAKELLGKYKLGICTDTEKDLVESWYQKSGIDQPEALSEEVIEESLDRVWSKLNTDTPPVKVTRLWTRIAGVAAAVALIVYGVYFFKYQDNKQDVVNSQFANDVEPGKVGATLTLANGKKIRLTDAANGELAKETGVVITKTASGQLIYEIKEENTESDKINILTTEKGETYQVRLPDGSSVWLNAASTLKYPASFARLKDRRVELSGEGYFQVAKDKAHPFIVKSGGQEVEVLGTHFNINAYADDSAVKTTLLEGSIQVHSKSSVKILKPGEQASLTDADIKVSDVETEDAIAWKNGYFMFNTENLESAMNKVARWYNVKVIYQDENLKNETLFGTISRYENVSKVLKMLARTRVVSFKLGNNTIYISRNNDNKN